MQIGSVHQKARPALSMFVIVCCIVTTALLYVMQKSTAVAENINSKQAQIGYMDYLKEN